ncbi:hypothetical protein L9F63_024750 [Diploptera punctata]|uniref:Protein-lysine N-methyltransferase SMYD4 n=1 Tax=Diploptera punctata TaxID=6984 RepID=A0AAD7ZF38_DIPPU|nr:hypothetical protein L9F63_024750 [Diploptera punctata]
MVFISVDNIFNVLCNTLQKHGEIESKSKLFSIQTTNSGRVKIATDLLKQENLLPDGKLLENKSLEKSIELRNLGNKEFMRKNDTEALLLYTKSIATAPFPINVPLNNGHEAEALSIAFANRSAVLFSLGKYELCLQDISQAIKNNYPKKLLYKLYERQGKCMQYLGRKTEGIDNINNALKWLSSAAELTPDKKKIIEAELHKLLKSFKNAEVSTSFSSHEQSQIPKCSYNRNQEILCASDCLELKYSPEMGRYISAARDIQPVYQGEKCFILYKFILFNVCYNYYFFVGDVLAVEKPFASVLLPDSFGTHCFNCLRHSETLLPCRFCSNVMYCSEECRSSSWDKNHSVDCSILSILQNLEINKMGFLALKILIIVRKTTDFKNMLISLQNEENLEERKKGFNNNNCYSSSDYSPIYWLVGNTEKRTVSDLFRRSITAACILHCLETMTDFFSDIDVNQYKYEIGGLLLRHLQNLPCNAHEVSELVKTNAKHLEEGASLWESIEIGAAAYAMLSLVNHSCDPNVVRHSYEGDTAVLRAIRPIATGEQVLDNYGFHHALHGKAERISHLESQYYFTCQCIACTEDWPCYNMLPSTDPTFICKRCKRVLPTRVADLVGSKTTTCIKCNETHDLAQIWKELQMSSEEFSHNIELVLTGGSIDWNEVAKKLIKYLILLDKNIHRPWKEYNDCQEALKQCFAMTANCYNP